MKSFTGQSSNVTHPIIGRIAHNRVNIFVRRHTILATRNLHAGHSGYAALLVSRQQESLEPSTDAQRVVELQPDELEALHTDDVVLIEPSGKVTILWDNDSPHNVLILTNCCNNRCIMCPQPIAVDNEDIRSFHRRILQLAKGTNVSEVAITGGEPTLNLDDLCEVIEICKRRFPRTKVSLLTNGRRFDDFRAAKLLAHISHPNLTYCIALCADVDCLHDAIVGAKGAFVQTIRAFHNLALLKQRIEIRIVILKQNYRYLSRMAEFIYRNFPFVVHIAFMGLEATGPATEHLDKIWIEPSDYAEELLLAVATLRQRNLHVSVYNLPLCILPERLWGFARDSISRWKKTFLPVCSECTVRDVCPGLFSTSERQSSKISPFMNEPPLAAKHCSQKR